MSRTRGKHTTPEEVVRSALHRMGFRFRLDVRIPVQSSSTLVGTSSTSSQTSSLSPRRPREVVPRLFIKAFRKLEVDFDLHLFARFRDYLVCHGQGKAEIIPF